MQSRVLHPARQSFKAGATAFKTTDERDWQDRGTLFILPAKT
jgi:hypothetical protein